MIRPFFDFNAVGLVHADIALINGAISKWACRHIIGKNEVKRRRINALVDIGSHSFVLTRYEEQLQLPVVEKLKTQIDDGFILACEVMALVKVRFKNRATTCQAMVLPADS